jgi:poly-gamma-glutamate capsule biosynthesis protein CapA/YwtB (metallophosphatase superfamily)
MQFYFGGLPLKRSIICDLTLSLLIISILSGCMVQATPVSTPTLTIVESTATPTEVPVSLWIDNLLPTDVQNAAKAQTNVPLAGTKEAASLILSLETSPNTDANLIGQIQWVYALEAPFPTVTDNLSFQELKALWTGVIPDSGLPSTLLVSSETKAIFDALWGQSNNSTVTVATTDQFTNNDLKDLKTWALVPFGEITPRWKVIQVNGLNPLDKPLDTHNYSLMVNFDLKSISKNDAVTEKGKTLFSALPTTNRDESKMTVLVMTGTTALTRAIAYKMEIKGLDYPIEKVKNWFANADLIHVSNEVSFNADCPYPDYQQHGLRFCSAPKYIQTLQDLGVNVVELTGNHENDYGPEYLDSSIDAYKEAGMNIYGGGKTQAEAAAPLKVEANGNKIAFIGCNPNGPKSDWATDTTAGSAQCDMAAYQQQIKDLKVQGYVVVATFQHEEVYTYLYGDVIANDFRNAAKAGADIVSGSQSHYAMAFQFEGNSIIHYGLGNFLFDQMTYEGGVGDNIRREFFDKHVIYDGKYISTELYTAWLMDWSQPNPMDQQQRSSFLTEIFNASMWSDRK